MSVAIIKERLAGYNCKSEMEENQALREITQELVLASLGRTDFFKEAAFQGGTCLRILYGLNRFSEDLDFVLKENNPAFVWQPHLAHIQQELSAYGYNLEMVDRSLAESAVKKAFLKEAAIGKILNLQFTGKAGMQGKIRIKLEIDTNPPEGSEYELKFIDFPFVTSILLQNLPTLFSGKIHALLCRDYIKGRDWYDFLWYTARKTPINYTHLSASLEQLGPWKGKNVVADNAWCLDALKKKIENLDWPFAAEDVRRFIPIREQKSLDHWSKDLFLQQLEKLETM